MPVIEWLLTAFSDIDVWDRNTRPRRGDDEAIAEYKGVCRRAGFSILAMISALVTAVGWAVLGPSAGESPYRGLSMVLLWMDRVVTGLVLLSLLLAVVRCYKASTFRPEQ